MVSKTNGKDFMDVQATTMKDFSHFCNIRLEDAKDIEGITWPRGDTKFLFEC